MMITAVATPASRATAMSCCTFSNRSSSSCGRCSRFSAHGEPGREVYTGVDGYLAPRRDEQDRVYQSPCRAWVPSVHGEHQQANDDRGDNEVVDLDVSASDREELIAQQTPSDVLVEGGTRFPAMEIVAGVRGADARCMFESPVRDRSAHH